MRLFAVLASVVLFSGCSALKCGTHTLGDDSYREACGVMGSWGAHPRNDASDEAVHLSLEPWGNDIYDEDAAEPRVRPGFIVMFHEGWLGDDVEVPPEALIGACVDMGVAHEADRVELTVLGEGRHLPDDTGWRLQWNVVCDDWRMSSEGKDVLSLGNSNASFERYTETLGRPPAPQALP